MITGNLILSNAFFNSSSLEISKYCAVLTPYSINAFFIFDLSLHMMAAFSGSPVNPKESQVFPRAEIPVSRQQVATPSNLSFAAFLATSSGFAIFIKHTSSARGIPGGLLSGMVPAIVVIPISFAALYSPICPLPAPNTKSLFPSTPIFSSPF